jgi:hypothetical protein
MSLKADKNRIGEEKEYNLAIVLTGGVNGKMRIDFLFID